MKRRTIVRCLVVVLCCTVCTSVAATAGKVAPGPVFQGETAWTYANVLSSSDIRGLAYDGTYFYVADYYGPGGDAGPAGIYRVRAADGARTLVYALDYAHGVATDGTTLWTTDYSATIFQVDIATGNLVKTIPSPVVSPIRLDYDAKTRSLWLTAYGDPKIYQLDLTGKVLKTINTGIASNNVLFALDGSGGIWASPVAAEIPAGARALYKFTIRTGALANQYVTDRIGWYAMCTNVLNRAEGLYWDDQPLYDSVTGLYGNHIEKHTVK